MCGHFCTRFIDFILEGKNLLHYTNLFPPIEYKNMINNKVFSITKKVKMKIIYLFICGK